MDQVVDSKPESSAKDLDASLAAYMQFLKSERCEVLKISTIDGTDDIVLRIEGKLVAPWTPELESVWQNITDSLNTRKLLLDIRDTTAIDQGGFECLARIAQVGNARILADTPLTRQFADRVQQMKASQEGRRP